MKRLTRLRVYVGDDIMSDLKKYTNSNNSSFSMTIDKALKAFLKEQTRTGSYGYRQCRETGTAT